MNDSNRGRDVLMGTASPGLRRRLMAGLVAASVVALAGVAPAEQAWVRRAKVLFDNDEYGKVIELAEPHRKQTVGVMFLAFSHLQEYVFNGTKYDKEMFKSFKLQLEKRLTSKDIDDLIYFVDRNDKPEVVKEARRLSKVTFKNIKQVDEVPKLVKVLSSTDEGTRELALSSIKEIIERRRKYVDKGGTLRATDIQVMGSSKLIVPLLDRIEEKNAARTLVMVEEPVLEYLPRYDGQAYVKLDVDINKKITKRKQKYPESNWYSAVGKTR